MSVEIRTIHSLQHPLVKHWVKLRENRSYRYEQRALVVEGFKPVQELCRRFSPRSLVTCDRASIPEGGLFGSIFEVSREVMQKISGMVSPEGLIAEINMPADASLEGLQRVVAFDGVSEPGNLGSLMRSALALGWQGAFFLENCCDPYNEKALRAARGATFKLPHRQGSWETLQKLLNNNEWTPLVADLEGIEPTALPHHLPAVLLLLGNEAHGPREVILQACQRVTIPIAPEIDSLNVAVAGALLMYAFRQPAPFNSLGSS